MKDIPQSQIRNFSIIAHIDHGKSTLADRFIAHCEGLSEREMRAQVLDTMPIERERGITVKAQCVSLTYSAKDGKKYQLNLIDTPGHVDFSYEVSRSLAACEGALLVVDCAQGVEAQTVATCYTAIEQGLTVIPVLNKIDLPQAEPERAKQEIEDVIGIDAADALTVSAKTGVGVPEVLEQIIALIPAPSGDTKAPLQALIMDSWFDNYLGVVSLVRIMHGKMLSTRDKVKVMSSGRDYGVDQLGVFTPKRTPKTHLATGEVGYVVAGIKDIYGAPVGDTLTLSAAPAGEALPGLESVQPQVYAGIYPLSNDDFESLRESLGKLKLNDAALFYEPESSDALGFGFRCGFLGLLHMDIVHERLSREYQLELLMTAPTVVYEVLLKDQQSIKVDNPSQLPAPHHLAEIREPIVLANMLLPADYLGAVMTLCEGRRGVQKKLTYLSNQVSLVYELPMNEVVLDFFDRLKSATRGFASLDYHLQRFQTADLVKLDILINGEKVDALAAIVHRSQVMSRGRRLTEKLRELIPRQMFEIAIQAVIGGKIIARSSVRALRKNVTAKCYGGDVSRKRKLLEKQKAGKKRMKQVGKVSLPQDAFLAVLKLDRES